MERPLAAKLHNMICICHRVSYPSYLSLYHVYIEREKESAIHFILDTIYLFRAHLAYTLYTVQACQRGMLH